MEAELYASDGKNELTIYRDEDAESPRNDETLGKMICWHRRYSLGDKHEYERPLDFKESDEAKDCFVCLPVYLYDHSGITISNSPFNDRWDSGQVGYIYATKERVREFFGIEPNEQNKDLVTQALIDETEQYDSYLQGDVYGYSIVDQNGEEADNANGYIGDIDKVVTQMKESTSSDYGRLFEQLEKQTEFYAAM